MMHLSKKVKSSSFSNNFQIPSLTFKKIIIYWYRKNFSRGKKVKKKIIEWWFDRTFFKIKVKFLNLDPGRIPNPDQEVI